MVASLLHTVYRGGCIPVTGPATCSAGASRRPSSTAARRPSQTTPPPGTAARTPLHAREAADTAVGLAGGPPEGRLARSRLDERRPRQAEGLCPRMGSDTDSRGVVQRQ